MAITQAQIDAAKAVLADALAAYNNKVVPDWNAFAAAVNAGLPQLQAVGLDPAQAIALLNQVVAGINPAGQAVRAMSDAVAALSADPVPVPIPTSLVVHTAPNVADCIYRDKQVRLKWQHALGDWIDGAGVLQGPQPTINASCTNATVDISALHSEVMIQGINSVTSVAIDGVVIPSVANAVGACISGPFWTDPTSNHSLPLPSRSGRPVIVPNAGGKTMTVIGNTSGNWRVDAVYLPPVQDYAPIDTYSAPDILLVDCTDQAAMTSAVKGATWPNPWVTGSAEFGVYNGMPYLRCSTDAIGDGRIVNVQYPSPPLTEIYFGEAAYIEDDVWPALNDLGVKWSGTSITGTGLDIRDVSKAWATAEQSGVYYGARNPLNRNIFGLDHYVRDGQTGPSAIAEPPNAYGVLTTNRWYWVEGYVKLNTPGLPDGILRQWINGHLICEQTNRPWRWGSDVMIHGYDLQRYHGGTAKWLTSGGPAHERVGRISISSKPIGTPPELR